MITIGMKQDKNHQTTLEISNEFLTPNALRDQVNDMYERNLKDDEKNSFDMMILRETQKEIFWHCIFYFIDGKLPYDFILSYEDNEKISVWLY